MAYYVWYRAGESEYGNAASLYGKYALSCYRSGITSHHVGGYTPIEAQLGFRIRPYRDLLIDIYGGYAYRKNKITTVATVDSVTVAGVPILPGTFTYFYGDYGRGKIGAAFSYHYQDIITIHLLGNYYFGSLSAGEHRERLFHQTRI